MRLDLTMKIEERQHGWVDHISLVLLWRLSLAPRPGMLLLIRPQGLREGDVQSLGLAVDLGLLLREVRER